MQSFVLIIKDANKVCTGRNVITVDGLKLKWHSRTDKGEILSVVSRAVPEEFQIQTVNSLSIVVVNDAGI